MKTRQKNFRDHLLVLAFLVIASTIFYLPWFLNKSKVPTFEEGLLDVSAVHYSAKFLETNHHFPQLWNNRTYSQSMDQQYYQTTFVELPATLISAYLNVEPIYAVAFTHLILTALIVFVVYLTMRLLQLQTIFATLVSLVFLATNAYFFGGVAASSMRLLVAITGFVLTVYLALAYALREKVGRIGQIIFILLIFISASMLSQANSLLPPQTLVFLLVLFLVLRKKFSINIKKMIPVAAVIVLTIVLAFINIEKARQIDPEPNPNVSSIFYNEAPSLFGALNLSLGNLNRPPLAVQNFGLTWSTQALVFLVIVIVVFGLAEDSSLALLGLFAIVFLCLTAGPNGPLAKLTNLIPYFRSSGRTFFLLSHYAIIIIFGLSTNSLLRKEKIPPAVKIIAQIVLFALVLLPFALNQKYLITTRQINPELSTAYKAIPPGSTINLLPQGLKDAPYSANAENYHLYREDLAVSFSLLHQHEYLSEINDLQNTSTPPNQWTIPILTRDIHTYFDWRIRDGEYSELKKYYQFLNPDLGYLVIYNQLIKPEVIDNLQKIGWDKFFENSLVTILKNNQTLGKFALYKNAFATFSDSYDTGISSIASLPQKDVNQNLFINADKDKNFNFETSTLPLLLNNYDLENVILDEIYKNKVSSRAQIKCPDCYKIDWIQPSLSKETYQLQNKSAYLELPKSSEPRIFFIRILAGSNVNLSSLKIFSLNNEIGFQRVATNNNYFWIKTDPINTDSLRIEKSGSDDYIELDAALALNANEYNTESARLKSVVEKQIQTNGFLSVIEPENRMETANEAKIYTNQGNPTSFSRNSAICFSHDTTLKILPSGFNAGNLNLSFRANKKISNLGQGFYTASAANPDYSLDEIASAAVHSDGTITIKPNGNLCLDVIYISNKKITDILADQRMPLDVTKQNDENYNLHCQTGGYLLVRQSYSPNWTANRSQSYIANFFQNSFAIKSCPIKLNYHESLLRP